jgi:hypothetical protein
MDYLKIYNQLISKRQQILTEGYSEKHHIVPKCMNGTNDTDNLVRLTAREHFIAHLLLAKIYGGPLYHAAFRMSCYKKYSSKEYEWLKINNSAIQSEMMKNRIVSSETRLKLSIAASGRYHSDITKIKMKESQAKHKKDNPDWKTKNPRYVEHWINLGFSEKESIKIIKEKYPIKFTDEQRKKANLTKTGKKISNETKEKMKMGHIKHKENNPDWKINNPTYKIYWINLGYSETEASEFIKEKKSKIIVSDETKIKMSESAKNRSKRICSVDTKIKIGVANKKLALERKNISIILALVLIYHPHLLQAHCGD